MENSKRSADKRPHPDTELSASDKTKKEASDGKRRKSEDIPRILGRNSSNSNGEGVRTLVISDRQRNESTALTELPRSSELKSPNMCLTGHGDAVHSVKFSHSGTHVATGSFDKQIFLWNVFGDCDNYGVLVGHKNAVQEVEWSEDNLRILSASADKTLGWWDVTTGERLRKFKEHENIVNTCSVALDVENTLASGSDDKTAKLWDPRERSCTHSFDHDFQVLGIAVSNDGQTLYTGGIDSIIRVWDVRKPIDPVLYLSEHTDIITGLSLSRDDSFLVSNAMDTKVCLWDVRPFVVGGDTKRLMKTFSGSIHNFEKLLLRCSINIRADRVAAGSADATACVWDIHSGELLYKLPGHKGPVREVVFHPSQSIIASCSSDKTVFLGEIA